MTPETTPTDEAQARGAGKAVPILEDACKPWEHHVGAPPDDDSPLLAVYDAGLTYGFDLLAKKLGAEDYTICDGTETWEGDVGGTLHRILVAGGVICDETGTRARLPAATAPATSGSVVVPDVEDLREEVAYWRRDLSARLWFLTCEYTTAVRESRWQDAAYISTKLNPALASYRSAQDKEWHPRCEACGEFVRPDEPSVGNDDVSGHARCLSEDRQDDATQTDTSEQDLARRVADAEAALAEEWSKDALAVPPAPARVEGDDLAGLSAAAPKGPWTVTYDEIGEGPDRRPVALLESADERIIAVDEEPDALECRSPVLEFAAALETAYRSGALIPATPTVGGTGEHVRHVKRNTEFEVLGEARALISGGRNESDRYGDWRGLYDGTNLTIYRCIKTGELLCSFADEVDDGRFERIAAPPPSGLSQAAGDGARPQIDGWTPNTAYGPMFEPEHLWPPEGHILSSLFHEARLEGGWKRKRYETLINYFSPPSDPARAAAPGGQTGEV